ncbi:unnamed protein product, partial [Mesorhabditis belari]|uniref:LIM zinc-binding domain-containing protein n=1 Tax=Mesorhabditis belari TaxID=2138241 RepID=A0AAF3EUH5_9BILA
MMRSQSYICGGCNQPIIDRYMLNAADKFWHEACLKCSCCQVALPKLGSRFFVKYDQLLCKNDYQRLYCQNGECSSCQIPIPPNEMVMRVKDRVFHLRCFTCNVCNEPFCVGDRFHLFENKIICEADYEERRLFMQASFNDQSMRELTKNIEELVDFEPVNDCVHHSPIIV